MVYKSTFATIAIGLALAGSAPAQQPNADLCRSVLQEFPADHLVLMVRVDPSVRIDCAIDPDKTPVVLTFASAVDLDWYRTHDCHRHIEPDEGPDD